MKKLVTINDSPKVYYLVKWSFAYRQARISEYQKHYSDRMRFERRIIQTEIILYPILKSEHRTKIYFERFM